MSRGQVGEVRCKVAKCEGAMSTVTVTTGAPVRSGDGAVLSMQLPLLCCAMLCSCSYARAARASRAVRAACTISACRCWSKPTTCRSASPAEPQCALGLRAARVRRLSRFPGFGRALEETPRKGAELSDWLTLPSGGGGSSPLESARSLLSTSRWCAEAAAAAGHSSPEAPPRAVAAGAAQTNNTQQLSYRQVGGQAGGRQALAAAGARACCRGGLGLGRAASSQIGR
jgi:hypothetical protein